MMMEPIMAIFDLARKKTDMPTAENALPGRSTPLQVEKVHYVMGQSIFPPFEQGMQVAMFGMGCFWGVERIFWKQPGVVVTAVGYSAGITPNPTYEEVCTGLTGHNEVVLVVFDPSVISYEKLLQVFFENHDPTQGMRQGNDVGTQYRSGIYSYSMAQETAAKSMKSAYETRLRDAGLGAVTTEIKPASDFYYAETYHQQYLAKNPNGYCGIGGTGVSCPIGIL
jgi:peptide-methionine (S)-S-oxide reductase